MPKQEKIHDVAINIAKTDDPFDRLRVVVIAENENGEKWVAEVMEINGRGSKEIARVRRMCVTDEQVGKEKFDAAWKVAVKKFKASKKEI